MFCRYCGSKIPDGTKYCQNCGKRINSIDNYGTQHKAEPDVERNSIKYTESPYQDNERKVIREKRKLQKAFWILFFIAMVIVIGTILFFLIWNRNKKEEPESYKAVDEVESQVINPSEIDDEILNKSVLSKDSSTKEIFVEPEYEDSTEKYIKAEEESWEGETEADCSSDYILEGSDHRYLDRAELLDLDQDQLRIARNELYARHGRIFSDDALQTYFNEKGWYHGTIYPEDFSDDMLNQYEIYNRDLIVKYEEEKGYR